MLFYSCVAMIPTVDMAASIQSCPKRRKHIVFHQWYTIVHMPWLCQDSICIHGEGKCMNLVNILIFHAWVYLQDRLRCKYIHNVCTNLQFQWGVASPWTCGWAMSMMEHMLFFIIYYGPSSISLYICTYILYSLFSMLHEYFTMWTW